MRVFVVEGALRGCLAKVGHYELMCGRWARVGAWEGLWSFTGVGVSGYHGRRETVDFAVYMVCCIAVNEYCVLVA